MSNRDAWTAYHHLGYLYAAVASSGDCSVGQAEMDVMSARLQEWNTDMNVADLVEIVVEATRAFAEDARLRGWPETVAASAEILRAELDEEDRAAAIDDLLAIAEADGSVLPDEEQMLDVIRRVWEIDVRSSADGGKKEPSEVDLSGSEWEDEEEAAERKQDFERDEWGPAHHIAYVYMAIALAEEGHLTEKRLRALAKMLPEYRGDPSSPAGLNQRMQMAFLTWIGKAVDADFFKRGLPSLTVQFSASVEYINGAVSRERRARIVDDVREIAGREPGECQQWLIDALEASLDLDSEAVAGEVEAESPSGEDERRLHEWNEARHLAYVCVALAATGTGGFDERAEVAILELLGRWEGGGTSKDNLVDAVRSAADAFTHDMAVEGGALITPSIMSLTISLGEKRAALDTDLAALVTATGNTSLQRDVLEAMGDMWRAAQEAASEMDGYEDEGHHTERQKE
jgi:uncharacterized tellurite resistance protein B-like protein